MDTLEGPIGSTILPFGDSFGALLLLYMTKPITASTIKATNFANNAFITINAITPKIIRITVSNNIYITQEIKLNYIVPAIENNNEYRKILQR